VEKHLAVAREMGATEEELTEVVMYAAAVGAGVVVAMARRAGEKSLPQDNQAPFQKFL